MSNAPFSSTELEAMRTTADAILNNTCNIQRATKTQDAFGGWSESFVTVAASAKCRVDLAGKSAGVLLTGNRIDPTKSRVISFPNGTNVQEGDRIVVNSVTYTVIGFLAEAWDITRRAVCEILR